MIERKDIEKLAALARIELKDEEKEGLRKDIDSILGYVDQIKKATAHTTPQVKDSVRNVMRDDTHPDVTGAHTDVLAAEFPRREGNSLKVKKIL